MTTIHDEEKRKELLTNDSAWSDNMREYAEHIRLKTIDEAIGCVPNSYDYMKESSIGFNTCRNQFITNLEQLKK